MGICSCVARPRLVEHEPPEARKEERTSRALTNHSKHLSIRDLYAMEEKMLGKGAYGAVYCATQRASGQNCAVKCLSKRSRRQTERCKKEVAIMKSLDHPNIVKLKESFQDDKNVYLVVELCKGGELLSRVASERSFSERKAAHVLQQILRGALYLHTRNIVHRDLKPENFLFSCDAPLSGNVLKIIDFGLARRHADGERLTTMAGTPLYVAPEVLAGNGYNNKCDLWGVGATAHVLLTGRPPFKQGSDRSVLERVRRGKVAFENKDWQHASPEARAFVACLLRSDPDSRPTAAKALTDAWLKLRCGGDSEKAKLPCGLLDSLRRFKSRHAFSKAVLHVVAGLLDDAAVGALRTTFTALDTDGDGKLSPGELREGLRLSGQGLPEQELQDILEGMDVTGNGTVEYTEFLAATVDRSKCQDEGVCRYAFDVFDWDGDGQISIQDLVHVLQNRRLSKALGVESQAVVEAMDVNGDGTMNLTDFRSIVYR